MACSRSRWIEPSPRISYVRSSSHRSLNKFRSPTRRFSSEATAVICPMVSSSHQLGELLRRFLALPGQLLDDLLDRSAAPLVYPGEHLGDVGDRLAERRQLLRRRVRELETLDDPSKR